VELNCPACRRGLPAGVSERCPFCGVLLAAPVEGALAPDPRLEPTDMEPLREIPGLRRPARTWKDEVRERVCQRKQERSGAALPLFPEDDGAVVAVAEPDAPEDPAVPEPAVSGLSDLGEEPPSLGGARVYDLGEPPAGEPAIELDIRPRDTRPFTGREPEQDSLLADDELEEPISERWGGLDEAPSAEMLPAVERPALAWERAQAAALDLGLLVSLWGVVVYFASRAAHVSVAGLLPSWKYLAGYLAALGLIYAGYFTGTTGQTLGKLAFGLRVVDPAGRPPAYLRALARALLGSLGVLAAAVGLVPMAFDPARRALHDRLLKTRVVRL
jgi:resuscitation-promoting factor RpfA